LADEKHDIYITNNSGKELACFEISNDQKGMLKLLIKQIKKYKEEISHLLDKHPENNIFRGLPGSGNTLSTKLLGELSDNKASIKN